MAEQLTSEFTLEDIGTLIESVDDWESVGAQEFAVMRALERMPLPEVPEDDPQRPQYDYIVQMKEDFKHKKQSIIDRKDARQESAVFLKAKLMLIRRSMNMNDLFEMPTSSNKPAKVVDSPLETKPETVEAKPEKLEKPVEHKCCGGKSCGSKPKGNHPIEQVSHFTMEEKLLLIENFTKDVGVWDHLMNFLNDSKSIEKIR